MRRSNVTRTTHPGRAADSMGQAPRAALGRPSARPAGGGQMHARTHEARTHAAGPLHADRMPRPPPRRAVCVYHVGGADALTSSSSFSCRPCPPLEAGRKRRSPSPPPGRGRASGTARARGCPRRRGVRAWEGEGGGAAQGLGTGCALVGAHATWRRRRAAWHGGAATRRTHTSLGQIAVEAGRGGARRRHACVVSATPPPLPPPMNTHTHPHTHARAGDTAAAVAAAASKR